MGFTSRAYKARKILVNEIAGVFALAGLFVGLGFEYYSYKSDPEGYKFKELLRAAILPGTYSLVAMLLHLYIRRYVRKTGAPIIVPLDGVFIKGTINVLTIDKAKLDKVDSNLTTAATEEDATAVNNLFKSAYKNSIWEKCLEETYKRNFEHLGQDHIIRLIKGGDKHSSIVGYTKILPLTDDGWTLFQTGKMNGSEITSEYIAFNQPKGLLILNLVNLEYRAYLSTTEWVKSKTGEVTINALAVHLELYCKNEFANKRFIPIMFENLNPNVRAFVKEYKINREQYSKEGAEIICFMLQNPFYIGSEHRWFSDYFWYRNY